MSHDPQELLFEDYDGSNFLLEQQQAQQIEYIRKYLSANGLNAKKTITELNFFDRDFLSEFSHFYSTSTHAYKNTCKRIHIFNSALVDKKLFEQALRDNQNALKTLKKYYLGFIVVRPLPHAPLGKTVLRWYPDDAQNTQRVTKTSRNYKINIGSVSLEVSGLSWQQQDEGVSACATIALWTLLHSSAYNEYRTIPTTAEITLSAHDNYSEGRHPFPSLGLTAHQICDSIIHHGLRPAVYGGDGDQGAEIDYKHTFSRRLFSHICASFLRSGFPVLLVGKQIQTEGEESASYDHTICLVGFRESVTLPAADDYPSHFDENIEFLYVHDDNLGPNVRFKIHGNTDDLCIKPSAPTAKDKPSLFNRFEKFIPIEVITAVNNDLRVSPVNLYNKGFTMADKFLEVWRNEGGSGSITFGVQYIKLTDFYSKELAKLLGKKKARLAKTRWSLLEEVSPMSKYVGLIRVGLNGVTIFDMLCDTSQVNPIPYATLCYHSQIPSFLSSVETDLQENLGKIVKVFLDI